MVNGLVVGTMIWTSMQAAPAEVPTEQTYFVELTPDVSMPTPPPPPPPPELSTASASAEAVVEEGFLTLDLPNVILAEIPPPILGTMTIRAADFTGQGVEGGRARDAGDTLPPPVEAGPAFTPYTVAPFLRNAAEVARALRREYPSSLRDAGIGAQVLLWLFIDQTGRVQRTVVKTSSGFETLDAAAARVAMIMEFSPALNRDRNVPVWVSVPVDFKVS
jgi:protein TonB